MTFWEVYGIVMLSFGFGALATVDLPGVTYRAPLVLMVCGLLILVGAAIGKRFRFVRRSDDSQGDVT